MTIQIDSVKAKLLHAHECINAVKEEVGAWMASNPYSIAFQTNADSTRYSIILRINKEPTLQRWSLRISDIIHNLRCALDHLVYAIAIHETGQDPPLYEKRLMFPICDTSANFRDESKRRLTTLSISARTIIENLQPYNRPHPDLPPILSILRDFDNTDKHKLLRLAYSAVATMNIGFYGHTDLNEVKVDFVPNTGELKDGAEIAAFVFDRPTPDMQFERHIFYIIIAIKHGRLDNSAPTYTERNDFVSVIRLLMEEVETVIDTVLKTVGCNAYAN